MKSYIAHALSTIPVQPRALSVWDSIQKIGRDTCQELPYIIEKTTDKDVWVSVFEYHQEDSVRHEASNLLTEGFQELGIRVRMNFTEENARLQVRASDLKEKSIEARKKSDVDFREMMRGR